MPEEGSEQDALVALIGDLTNESDRGIAVLIAAFADEQLGRLIETRFKPQDKCRNELSREQSDGLNWFRGDRGPISTFSARTYLAYLMGLIHDHEYRALVQLREIRNAFAHQYEQRSFADPQIRDKCVRLWRELGIPEQPCETPSDPRVAFIWAGCRVLVILDQLLSIESSVGQTGSEPPSDKAPSD